MLTKEQIENARAAREAKLTGEDPEVAAQKEQAKRMEQGTLNQTIDHGAVKADEYNEGFARVDIANSGESTTAIALVDSTGVLESRPNVIPRAPKETHVDATEAAKAFVAQKNREVTKQALVTKEQRKHELELELSTLNAEIEANKRRGVTFYAKVPHSKFVYNDGTEEIFHFGKAVVTNPRHIDELNAICPPHGTNPNIFKPDAIPATLPVPKQNAVAGGDVVAADAGLAGKNIRVEQEMGIADPNASTLDPALIAAARSGGVFGPVTADQAVITSLSNEDANRLILVGAQGSA